MTSLKEKYFEDFSWAVPFAFADALGACRFERGDTLYDTKRAYKGTWGEAIIHISYSIQVKSPSRTTVARTQKEEESVFTTNWKQRVVFDLTDHMNNVTREVITTQGRLYTLLWRGDRKCLDKKTDTSLKPPLLAMSLVKKLKNRKAADIRKAVPYFKRLVAKDIKEGMMFLMPYDRSKVLLRKKYENVKSGFTNLKTRIELASPKKAGLISETEFAPTVKIACFCVERISISELNERLKKALYNPAKNKKSKKEQFRITTHGHLESIGEDSQKTLF